MLLRLLSARARLPFQSRRVYYSSGTVAGFSQKKVVTTAALPYDLHLAVATGNRADSVMELVIRVRLNLLSPPCRSKVFMSDIAQLRGTKLTS
jgi:hypothetical protein